MALAAVNNGARESSSTEPKTSGASTEQTEIGPGETYAPGANDVETGANTAEDAESRGKPLGFYLSFLAINILVFLYSLDATTLAVAIPAIASELHGTTLESFWAGIAYFLGLVVSQPLYATISDVIGRKPPLYVGFLLFTAGSLTFSLARNMAAIIAGRIIQGLGGGGLDVLGEIIVSDMTTLKERPLYLGIMSLPIAIGSILGPTIGALFSDFVTWRWIGWINLPLLGISCPLLLFFLKLKRLESTLETKLKRLDWSGMLVFTVGCTLFVLPISWADSLYPWKSYQTILPLLLGFAVLAGFAIYEAKPEAPVMPHRLFRSRTAIVTLCGGFVHGMTLYTLLQYLPLFYQAVMLDTRILSAVSLLPTSVASVVGAISSVIAIGKAGFGYKHRIWLAWALVTLGTGLFILLDESSSTGMRYGIPIIWGIGIGALLRLLHIPMQASVPSVDDTGHAIALLLTMRCLGGLVGLAIGSTVFSSVFGSVIATIGGLPESLAALRDAHDAVAFIPMLRTLDLPADILGPVVQTYLTAMRAVFYVMIGFSGLGLVSSLLTEELSLQRTDRGRQAFET
ncbi:MFS general substrate transporter [Annulohypoxylon truncatum]|uniref:MFS general substrate transporter n=1 Tax=Annulohypoxylon truncatum TaxID=327061 RepID=UPI002007EAC7|nr:MFS general substrate transporter [Annulohypoxylon truncatum]KAI1209348.1 MFS general substrate transporter [Annulohypoxylon truncatum]